ncbi:MAG: hypothetical protein PHE21_04145 [Candidatus Dojkabacteria bacterium]|nr:hypothetical protein [Candidatus Dojkabacteria bacterium]
MNILVIQNTVNEIISSGCFKYRVLYPMKELERRGHKVSYIDCSYYKKYKEIIDKFDVIFFSRAYRESIKRFLTLAKKKGKKIVYELDDNFWEVDKSNPAYNGAKNLMKFAETCMKEADMVTTTTEKLAIKLREYNDNVVVLPNAVDLEKFKSLDYPRVIPVVLYSGSATHWVDLEEIITTLYQIQQEIPFKLILQGFTKEPLDAAANIYSHQQKFLSNIKKYDYQKHAINCMKTIFKMDFFHIPFYPPLMHEQILNNISADIGLAPITDLKFNEYKSAIKYYEYAAGNTVTLAPDKLPYKGEIDYTYTDLKDFEYRFKKLLTDKKFRKEILLKQKKFVVKNRDMKKVGEDWNDAFENLLNK